MKIRRTVGQAIEPAAAFQAAGVCVTRARAMTVQLVPFGKMDKLKHVLPNKGEQPYASRSSVFFSISLATFIVATSACI